MVRCVVVSLVSPIREGYFVERSVLCPAIRVASLRYFDFFASEMCESRAGVP